MHLLDCASFEAAAFSVAALWGIAEPELVNALRDIDLVAWSHHYGVDASEFILTRLAASTARPAPTSTMAKWFHATRVPRSTDFKSQGLKPLASCHDELERLVDAIASGLAIPAEIGRANFSYFTKLESLDQQGPCAFLLKDAARGAGRRCRFIDCPEVILDLAELRAGDRASEIINVYKERTASCIVTFTAGSAPSALRHAVAYLHAVIHDDEDPTRWGTTFDGRGVSVPPEAIFCVEWADG